MAYKAQRNNALRSSYRLVKPTYKGKTWYSDTYFATAFDIFSDYKLKKSQYIMEEQPKLDDIIGEHELSEVGNRIEATHRDLKSYFAEPERYLSLTGVNGKEVVVQKKYVDLFKAIYPKCELFIESQDGHKRPVHIKNNGVIVGVIMPVRT